MTLADVRGQSQGGGAWFAQHSTSLPDSVNIYLNECVFKGNVASECKLVAGLAVAERALCLRCIGTGLTVASSSPVRRCQPDGVRNPDAGGGVSLVLPDVALRMTLRNTSVESNSASTTVARLCHSLSCGALANLLVGSLVVCCVNTRCCCR